MALIDDLALRLARFDDDALIALANTGLLRRARKDLERIPPVLVSTDDRAVTYAVDDQTVVLDARGPAGAACDCSASGVCRHILAALLVLRAMPRTADTVLPSPCGELTAFTVDDLAAWAGRAAYAAALAFLARDVSAGDVAIENEGVVTIGFARPPLMVRYPGGGLDAAIVERGVRNRKQLVVAAVLAFQRARGVAVPEPEARPATAARRDAGLRAARRDVVRAVRALAAEAVEVGIVHLSAAQEERFVTLGVASAGAELYRLALLLRRVGDHVHGLASRDARADEERLLDDLATLYALASAIGSHLARGAALPAYLAGEARAAYEEIGRLELIGAGAYPWRTGSGYVGLTALFYAPVSDRWMSWSEARPAYQAAFDPFARYVAPGPWDGCDAPAQLAGTRLTVLAAHVNRFGRIGTGTGTTAAPGPPLTSTDLRFGTSDFADWDELESRMTARTSAAGLHESNPHDAFAVVRPARYGRAAFDPVAQQLDWPLYDAAGNTLTAETRYVDLTVRTIERIEALAAAEAASLDGVVGRVHAGRGRLSIEPIALLRRTAPLVDVLAFASGAASGAAYPPPGHLDADAAAAPFVDRAHTILLPIGAALVRAAERGVGAALPETLTTEAKRAERGGAPIFSAAARATRSGEQLLRMRYIYGLWAASARP